MNNGYIGIRRNGVMILLFSILTCGIYLYYWYYTVMDDINRASGEMRIDNVPLFIVGAIFCSPIVPLIILYKADKELLRLAQENGVEYKENFILWLILTLFCGVGSFVAAFQISETFNKIWDARQNSGGPTQYYN